MDKKQTVTLACAFRDGCAPAPVPEIGLDGAILESGGKGGSVTSSSVRGGAGAIAGGKKDLSMVCKRVPTSTGIMQAGVLLPKFKHLFPVVGWGTIISVIRWETSL